MSDGNKNLSSFNNFNEYEDHIDSIINQYKTRNIAFNYTQN